MVYVALKRKLLVLCAVILISILNNIHLNSLFHLAYFIHISNPVVHAVHIDGLRLHL
jgi:hypothetical protein